MLKRLGDHEELTQEISRETNALNANLQKKQEDLKRLESEHEHNLARLREL